jgi:hypothetical protein
MMKVMKSAFLVSSLPDFSLWHFLAFSDISSNLYTKSLTEKSYGLLPTALCRGSWLVNKAKFVSNTIEKIKIQSWFQKMIFNSPGVKYFM